MAWAGVLGLHVCCNISSELPQLDAAAAIGFHAPSCQKAVGVKVHRINSLPPMPIHFWNQNFDHVAGRLLKGEKAAKQ